MPKCCVRVNLGCICQDLSIDMLVVDFTDKLILDKALVNRELSCGAITLAMGRVLSKAPVAGSSLVCSSSSIA